MSIKIENLVKQLGKKGKNACLLMSNISSYKKNKTLENISKIIEKNKNLILKANKIDLSNATKNKLKINQFDQAIDFFRKDAKEYENYFHHIGIYAFTNKALVRYVSLKRSKLELERKLEQLRALENSMSIHVGYINSSPLSVDTKKDLIEVKKIMERKN